MRYIEIGKNQLTMYYALENILSTNYSSVTYMMSNLEAGIQAGLQENFFTQFNLRE